MHRFYLPPEECKGTSLTLREREAHHAAHVLRLQRGEKITILDGVGHSFLCETQEVSRKAITLSVLSEQFTPPPPYEITLLQAIPKGKIIETIIQKATELGVRRIVPLLTERVTTHLDDRTAVDKLEKWQHTTIEATKQCGQTWLPRMEKPMTPQQYLSRNEPFELPLVAGLQSESRHPRIYIESFVSRNKRNPKSICIWVGPEGDFTPDEMQSICSTGVLPITLGRLVLRCETAAIYCLSFLNYELSAEVPNS